MTNPTLPRRDYYVYALFREDGRVFYIGKGRGPRAAISATVSGAENNVMKARAIAKTLRLLHEVPSIILADGLDEAAAFALERAFISAIGRHPRGPLLNQSDGGEGFSDPTGTTAEKIRQSLLGYKHSPQARENMRLSKIGHPVSEETRAKMRAAMRLRWPPKPPKPPRGQRSLSPEQKAALQAARRAKPTSEQTREKHRVASLGRVPSQETRAKLRAANLGKTLPPETRAKIAAAGTGRSHSIESRNKISARKKGWKPSEETLRRMSEGQRRRYSANGNKKRGQD